MHLLNLTLLALVSCLTIRPDYETNLQHISEGTETYDIESTVQPAQPNAVALVPEAPLISLSGEESCQVNRTGRTSCMRKIFSRGKTFWNKCKRVVSKKEENEVTFSTRTGTPSLFEYLGVQILGMTSGFVLGPILLEVLPFVVVIAQTIDFVFACKDGRISRHMAPILAVGGIVFLAVEFVGLAVITHAIMPAAPIIGLFTGEILALDFEYHRMNPSNDSTIDPSVTTSSDIEASETPAPDSPESAASEIHVRRELPLDPSMVKFSDDFAIYEYQKCACGI